MAGLHAPFYGGSLRPVAWDSQNLRTDISNDTECGVVEILHNGELPSREIRTGPWNGGAEKKFLKQAILDSKRREMMIMTIRLVASSSQILGRVHSALEQVRDKAQTGIKTKFKTKLMTTLRTNSGSDRMALEKVLVILHTRIFNKVDRGSLDPRRVQKLSVFEK
ncbi:hypothetical protein BU17DRAFT_66789 [Hysterangium stoloniferum]|nr:hypothetical protein BU17DRAFT_66789 [Hysterangium stoloniferum]